MTPLAVAFVAREKFSWSLASLRRLYALAGTPFTLYFVDGRYPHEARPGLERFLADKDNVVRVEADRFLYPNEALNLVLERAQEPYILLLQNDVLVARDAPAALLRAAQTRRCAVVAPVTLDAESGTPAPHREQEGARHFEMHCLLLELAAARSVGPLPPLSVHEHIDLGEALRGRGAEACFEDSARALFLASPPFPLRDFEQAYFRFRWDPARARLSQEHVRATWRLEALVDTTQFVARQQRALRPEGLLQRYASPFSDDLWDETLAPR